MGYFTLNHAGAAPSSEDLPKTKEAAWLSSTSYCTKAPTFTAPLALAAAGRRRVQPRRHRGPRQGRPGDGPGRPFGLRPGDERRKLRGFEPGAARRAGAGRAYRRPGGRLAGQRHPPGVRRRADGQPPGDHRRGRRLHGARSAQGTAPTGAMSPGSSAVETATGTAGVPPANATYPRALTGPCPNR